MKIKTKKLKTVFGAVASQNDECTIRSADDGWTIRTVDPSHVSMISISVPKDAFTDYVKSEDFALSLRDVLKNLSKAGEDTDITVGNGRFVMESDGLRSKYSLITPSGTDPNIPSLTYDAEAAFEAGILTKISSAVYGSVESYALAIKDGVFTIAAEDSSGNGVTLSVPKEQCRDIKGTAVSHFSIDMLDRFIKVLNRDGIIVMKLGNDIPVTVVVDDAGIRMTYLLAPRIESE